MIDIPALAARLNSGDLTITKLADGTGVILNLEGLQVLTLNETGMFLVEQLEGGNTTMQLLTNALTREFEVDEPAAAKDVGIFLMQLNGFLRD